MPYDQVPGSTKGLLGTRNFDTLIAEAGSVALETLLSKNKSVRRVIWVTKSGSSHLDWNEVPEGAGGKLDVSTWHDLIEEQKAGASNEVPPLDKDNAAPSVYALWPTKAGKYDLVEYSQQVSHFGIGLTASTDGS